MGVCLQPGSAFFLGTVYDDRAHQVAQAVHGGEDHVDEGENAGDQSYDLQGQAEGIHHDGDGYDAAAGNAAGTGGQNQGDQNDPQQQVAQAGVRAYALGRRTGR